MEILNVLIGAGFSKAAGLPLVSDINKYFNRRIYDRLRRHASDEWFWRDHGTDVENHNGSLNSDHIVYAFVFEEVLKTYGEMTNYEEFYDFLFHQKNEWFKEIFDRARDRCQTELHLDPDNEVIVMFSTYQYQKMVEIFNYLIIDVLRIAISDDQLVKEYKPFLKMMDNYERVHIFTLNHDGVLERLFGLTGRAYSDGFVTNGSPIVGDEEIRQPTFQNSFSENIDLRKLHGSDGLYQYPVGTGDGVVIHRTGEIIYFKPTTHHNKHVSRRVDADGNVLQTLNLDPTPKFITGKNKTELIEKDPMYSALYLDFEKELKSENDLLIVGYSYLDDHINKVIASGGSYSHVINVNPSKTYPYTNGKKISNVKFVKDL